MNAGAEFGQRLGAFFAVTMLRQFDVAPFIDAPAPFVAERVSFETAHPTDDLLLASENLHVFIQAKRSLSLSQLADSEFRSVVTQFLAQWSTMRDKPLLLLLALGPRASQRVSQELRKILMGLRIGDHGEDPLSISEHDTLETFRAVTAAAFNEIYGRDMDPAEFYEFSDHIRILTFDIEAGGPDERAAIILCSTITDLAIAPELLWGQIVRIAASCSAARQSIGRDALTSLVKKWIDEEPDMQADAFFDVVIGADLPCGREVIAFRSDDLEPGCVVVMDLARFNADGTPRVRFVGNTCTLKNGITGNLVARAATMEGLIRVLKQKLTSADSVAVVESPNATRDLDSEPAAKAHAAALRRSLERDRLLSCVQCGEPVSQAVATVVEIAQEDHDEAIGVVHATCTAPSHRIMGDMRVPFFAEHSRLINFDLEQWALALHRGQGVFSTGLPSLSRLAVLAWSPPNAPVLPLPYCLQFEFEDNVVQYATKRMRVERFSKYVAESSVLEYQHLIDGADPFALSTDTLTFGLYSLLARTRPRERIVRLRQITVMKISVPILESYSSCDNYYAPLMIVLLGDSYDLLEIAGDAVFLTNPLEFDRFYENWLRGGISLGKYRVDILSTDGEFDDVMRTVIARGACGIVNPLVDFDGRVIEGARIVALPSRYPAPER